MAVVEVVTQAKTGRSLRVKIGETWYGAALDSGIQKGMNIEPVVSTGKFGPWIDKWLPSGGPQPTAQIPPAPSSPVAVGSPPPNFDPEEPAVYTRPSDNVAPWYWPSVSNVCSSAIEKGLITKPEELNMWALKWAQVCVATKDAVK